MSALVDPADEALAAYRQRADLESSWRLIYRALAPRSHAQAFKLLKGDLQAAEDVVNQAFLHLYQSSRLEQFQSGQDLRFFFAAIVRNGCWDHLRKMHHLKSHVEVLDDLHVAQASTVQGTTPDSDLETRQTLDTVMSELEPGERMLLELTGRGYSLMEIASRLGLSNDAVASRLRRLRRHVAPHLPRR